MYALILAGGSGTRLNLGEKPLVTLNGKPMIEYVIKAFHDAGYEVVVILTGKTPYTLNWCRARAISYLVASGAGYIEDLAEAAEYLEIRDPFFSCVADLPFLSPATISEIREHSEIRKGGLLGMGARGAYQERRLPPFVFGLHWHHPGMSGRH